MVVVEVAGKPKFLFLFMADPLVLLLPLLLLLLLRAKHFSKSLDFCSSVSLSLDSLSPGQSLLEKSPLLEEQPPPAE